MQAVGDRRRRRRSVLPVELQRAHLGDLLHHLAYLSPDDVIAIEVLVRHVLEERWRERFYTGVRGGLGVTH